MKIETTRSALSIRMQHAAGYYGSHADLMSQLVPLVTAGLERGEPVAVALRPATEEALYEVLGSPPGLILLAQPDGPDSGSGQTVAARRARELRELTTVIGGPVTVLSEHSTRLDGVDGGFWTELDAAMNVALAELPVTLTCFFPQLPLHLEILDGARRNHPLLLVGGELRHNPEHRCPHEVLTERAAPAPVLLGPPDLRLNFTAWQLHEVRAAVEQALLAADYGRERAEDVVLAVNEVATNAVEHGATEAELCVWAGGDGVVCEVHDAGVLRDPLPGLQAPHPSHPRGRGVWIARQLCDSLHVWADAGGTHVRMRALR
jgi:anti-sigma regulatory factor (Ser/Thr protein kinase)